MKSGIVHLTGVVALCVGLLLATPTAAWEGGYTVFVPAPNGVDDTANLQRALDDCVRIGRDCTVQLAGGRYLTRQLVAYNFHGTFKGKSQSKTIVEALPNLPISVGDYALQGACLPNTTTCLWPSLIMFVDGDIRVSDLSAKVTAPPGTATTGWYFFGMKITDLIDVFRFMGHSRANVVIERVAIEGLPDDSPTSWGFNLINGAIYTGELPRTTSPFDYYFLSGSLTFQNNSVRGSYSGVSIDGFLKEVYVNIGGSSSKGNLFENVNAGVDLESCENSLVEVSHNVVNSSFYASLWVIQWINFVPARPSLFLIHDNTFRPSGPYADGIYLVDDPATRWIYALISNNKIEAQDIGYGGISAYNTRGTTVANNKVSGKGADAIGIWGGTYAAVLGNNVNAFVANPDAGLAQIVLDANTTQSTVVCKTPNDTVMDLGTGNKVMGCQAAASSAFSPKMASKLSTPSVQPRMKAKPARR